MAEALGHKYYRPELLSFYLPESILNFFQSRWIRIFQKGIICEAIVEVECEDNKRFYMRQHQLRRFFAMAFFWGNGYGSMDTLRWFLGHTDVQHLYHYITESTEGSVLKSVKAQYVYENLDKQEDLRSILIERYGTSNFSLIEREVLEDYIEDLIVENKLEVEPEFFTDDNGQNYKILIKVKGK
jgi:hypothetical protein